MNSMAISVCIFIHATLSANSRARSTDSQFVNSIKETWVVYAEPGGF